MKKGYLLILLSGVLAVSGCSRQGERERTAMRWFRSGSSMGSSMRTEKPGSFRRYLTPGLRRRFYSHEKQIYKNIISKSVPQ